MLFTKTKYLEPFEILLKIYLLVSFVYKSLYSHVSKQHKNIFKFMFQK